MNIIKEHIEPLGIVKKIQLKQASYLVKILQNILKVYFVYSCEYRQQHLTHHITPCSLFNIAITAIIRTGEITGGALMGAV